MAPRRATRTAATAATSSVPVARNENETDEEFQNRHKIQQTWYDSTGKRVQDDSEPRQELIATHLSPLIFLDLRRCHEWMTLLRARSCTHTFLDTLTACFQEAFKDDDGKSMVEIIDNNTAREKTFVVRVEKKNGSGQVYEYATTVTKAKTRGYYFTNLQFKTRL